jgi:uncharacterized membrane protein
MKVARQPFFKLSKIRLGKIQFSALPDGLKSHPLTYILPLAAFLFIYQIATESLWLDELISVDDVVTGRGLPPNNLIRPLYYMLLSFWMNFGESDAWLRGLGVIFGLGTVWLTYRLGRYVAGDTVGWLSALLLALSPLFINHVQEVRMYALSTGLGVAGSLALISALEEPQSKSKIWWAVLRVFALAATPLNGVLLLTDAVFIGIRYWRNRYALIKFSSYFAR